MVTHQVEAIIPEVRRVVGLKDCRISLDGSAQEALSGPSLSALFNTPLTVVEAGGYRQVLPG